MKGEICIVVPFFLKIIIWLTGKLDYTSRSYTYSYMGVCCSLCADAHHWDISSDQTSREIKKKGGKRTNPYRPKWYWLCKLDIRILLVFMKSCGWSGNSRSQNRDTLVGFWCSLAGTNGRGFRRKMVQGQMCAWRQLYGLLFFFLWMSYHTNNR